MPSFTWSSPVRRVARIAVGAALFLAVACTSAEKRIAGKYVRTWKEGTTPELGLDGEPDRIVLVLNADETWSSEQPEPSLQQFEVPLGKGTWRLDGVTLTLGPTDYGPMQYTVSGDTLFPRTPAGARTAERMTGYSMRIGEKTYLLRER